MSEIAILIASPAEIVLTVTRHLEEGRVDKAIDCFAKNLMFNDYGIDLEFSDKQRLTEFFQKKWELYPDSFLTSDAMVVSGEDVFWEWTLETMVTERFYLGLSRKVPISVHGVSVIRTKEGVITRWADYYDGSRSRRNALAAHFEEWV
jgi:hypothetical protein